MRAMHVPVREYGLAKPDLDEVAVAVGSTAQAVEHVDEVKAQITLYYVVITAKLRRYGLNCGVGEADSSTAVPHDPGMS